MLQSRVLAAGNIAGNLAAVNRRIEAALARAGRPPGTVLLVAVSKTFPPAAPRPGPLFVGLMIEIYCRPMRLSFLPAQLFLELLEDGTYQLRHGNTVAGRFKSKRAAISAFNELRRKLESEFPARELSSEEKRLLLIEELGRNSIRHNSLRNAAPRKSTGTRTFG